MSFDLFAFLASQLPSTWNAIAEASRECHHHLSIYERLVIGLAALRSYRLVWTRSEKSLHYMVFQIDVGIMIPIFINQLTVQAPFLSNFYLKMISLQVINLCPGVLWHWSVTCHVFEWNPDLSMQKKIHGCMCTDGWGWDYSRSGYPVCANTIGD